MAVLNSFKKIILQGVKLKKKTIFKMSKSFEGLLAKKERKGECVRMSERVFESGSERGNIFANILHKPDFSILSPCR